MLPLILFLWQNGPICPILSWPQLYLWTRAWEPLSDLDSSLYQVCFSSSSFISCYPVSLGLSAVLLHPDFLCLPHSFRGWGLWPCNFVVPSHPDSSLAMRPAWPNGMLANVVQVKVSKCMSITTNPLVHLDLLFIATLRLPSEHSRLSPLGSWRVSRT